MLLVQPSWRPRIGNKMLIVWQETLPSPVNLIYNFKTYFRASVYVCIGAQRKGRWIKKYERNFFHSAFFVLRSSNRLPMRSYCRDFTRIYSLNDNFFKCTSFVIGTMSSPLSNFEIRVGILTDHIQNPMCGDRVRQLAAGEVWTAECKPPIPGRHVSVSMVGKGYLAICEVAVFARLGEWKNCWLVQIKSID